MPIFQLPLPDGRILSSQIRPLIMGILNVTPDSFSDGGLFAAHDAAIAQAERMAQEGADIIDIGGESTRPGAKVADGERASSPTATAADAALPASNPPSPVSEQEELKRVVPVIRELKQKRHQAVISVDTYKANVAKAAIEVGAEIVNDVSGFRWDLQMPKTLAALKCGAVLMHMRGRPDEWRTLPPVADIVTLVKRELRDWADVALMAGVKRERLVLDPGFGFGKSFQENYPLLRRFEEFHQLRYPVMVGVSRKSFIGRALARDGNDIPIDLRSYGTTAAETVAVLKGAHIIRTHDVRICAEAMKIADIAAG
jgi:dihydropteroate synthase